MDNEFKGQTSPLEIADDLGDRSLCVLQETRRIRFLTDRPANGHIGR